MAKHYLSWERDDLEGLPDAWAMLAIEVEDGRVLRELAVDAQGRVVYRSPSDQQPRGQFDLQMIDTECESDLTPETFDTLWSQAQPSPPTIQLDGWVVTGGTPLDLPRSMQMFFGMAVLTGSLLLLAVLVAWIRLGAFSGPVRTLLWEIVILPAWSAMKGAQMVLGRRSGDDGAFVSEWERVSLGLLLIAMGFTCAVGSVESTERSWPIGVVIGLAAGGALLKPREARPAGKYLAIPGPRLRGAAVADRLPVLKEFEREAMVRLLSSREDCAHLAACVAEAAPAWYWWTGDGYVLALSHDAFAPVEHLPDAAVSAVADGMYAEYRVALDPDGCDLQLVCSAVAVTSANAQPLPEDFRRRNVTLLDGPVAPVSA